MTIIHLLAGATLALSTALAGQPGDVGTTPPDVVTASLQEGGAAYQAAEELDADELAVRTLTFGTIHRYAYLDLNKLAGGARLHTSDVLGDPTLWLAVVFADGVPFSVAEVDNSGALVQLDGWTQDTIEIIAALDKPSVILGAGMTLGNFLVNDNGTTLTPLDAQSRAFATSGSAPMSSSSKAQTVALGEFWGAARSELAKETASQADGGVDNHPSGGGGVSKPLGIGPAATWALVTAFIVGATMVVLQRRRRRARR